MNMLIWLETILQDINYTLRQMARNRVFTAVAVTSLAIGIGTNTAIFSIINAALFKPLPVRHPEELVMLTDPEATGVTSGIDTGERRLLSYAEFERLRAQVTTLAGLCAVEAEMNRWHLRIGGGPLEEARARLVSEDYFTVLGARPAIGRLFTSEDARGPGQDPYVVISYNYWQRRFGGRTSALGTSIQLRAGALTIIGVTAPGFRGENMGDQPDLWMPMMMQPIAIPGRDWLHDDLSGQISKVMWLHAFGRLKPGASRASTQAEIDVLFHRVLDDGYPTTIAPETRRKVLDQRLTVREARTGAFAGRKELSRQLLVLLGASMIVLAVACLNVANLLLARALSRGREVSIRLSTGASRARLVRQFLTESLVLSFLGGAAGLAVASGLSGTLVALLGNLRTDLDLSPSLDSRLLVTTLGLTMFTGILFGLAPALRGANLALVAGLKEGVQSTSARGKLVIARTLAICQIGLCLLAVVFSGLLLRTIRNLQSVDLGYQKENLLLVTVDGVSAGYRGDQLSTLWRELTSRFRALPGVQAASYSINGLFSDAEADDEIEVEGFAMQREDEIDSRFDMVGPEYFSTIGIPLLRGREFTLQDTSSAPHVCVINESFARVYFSGRDPIGRHVLEKSGDQRSEMMIVGIVRNSRDHDLREPVPPRFFVPGDQGIQGPNQWATFEIRTRGDPAEMVEPVRKAVVSLNDNLYPRNCRPLIESLEGKTAHSRMIAGLCSIFAFVALLQAIIGLYGVLSYGVDRRMNEIGIRIAMGANQRRIVAMVVNETGILIAIGSLFGVALLMAVKNLITNWVYGLSALDPATIAAAVVILGVVAFIAACVPAGRAARTDPTIALRRQ